MKECPHKPELEESSAIYRCPACGMAVMGGMRHIISDGTVCLACGADGFTVKSDPNCKYCSKAFKGLDLTELDSLGL